MESSSALLALCVVHSPRKGQWREALMFSFICVWINGWVNNRESDDLRRRSAYYDVTVMLMHAWGSYDGIWHSNNHAPVPIELDNDTCWQIGVLKTRIKSSHYNGVIMSAMASQITSLTIVYSTVYLGADQRKHQISASLAFVRGIHRGPVNSPHKGPVTRKMFSFDDVNMI